jgi:3-oxoadipate enol-lactonase
MPHVIANGVSLYYEEAGSGPPLLLIAGLGANRNSWATVVPVLSARYRVFTFDNRGAGRSEVPPGPYAMEDMAHDTAALIDHLGTGPMAAIGWSMGGVILQSLLIDHPDKVSVAVLLSTLPSYTELQHPWLDGLLALRQAGVDPITLATASLPWAFTPHTLTDHPRTRHLLELGAKDPEPTGYAGFTAQASGIRVFDRRSELGSIRTPTLVLVGAEDVLTPPAQAIDIASRLPDASLVVLPRGSHAMIIEFPAPTLAAIESFLEAQPTSPARDQTAPAVATAVPTSNAVALDGLTFHYLDWGGDGPPLVMLHGFTGHAHSWDHTAEVLRGRYRVLALDQRGHGDSQWAETYGSHHMVEDVRRFLDALGLDRVTLMGLSMGGNVAYLFAAEYPERVDRLVVLDIGPAIAPAGAARIAGGLEAPDTFASEAEAISQARAANPRPSDKSLRHRVTYNLRPTDDGRLTWKWDKALRDGTARRHDHSEADRWAAWRSVTCPTLLVRGADSDILAVEVAEEMVAGHPDATLAVVADCGHSITLDRPEGLVEALRPWLLPEP